MSAGPRLLIRCPGRRGLGHLMRGLNIAREVRALDPSAEIVFCTPGNAASDVLGDEFPHMLETESMSFLGAVRRLQPRVVVLDTVIPAGASPGSARVAYVMRKSRESRHEEILRHPVIAAAHLILVPHTREEFGRELPPALAARTVFTGPIVRRPSTARQIELRRRLGLPVGSPVVTSTAGGGGYADTASPFLAAVASAHPRLLASRPDLRHVVVTGPSYAGAMPEIPGATVLSFEPDLVELFALSEVVVAEGGYNTVAEVREARTPAILLPGRRRYDDQRERARAMEARGLAAVVDPSEPDAAGAAIASLVRSPEWATRARAAYRTDRTEIGNRRAAEALLALAA